MKYRFALVYIFLGACLVLPYAGLALVWNHSASKGDVKAQIAAAVPNDAVVICEKAIEGALVNQGGTVQGFQVAGVLRTSTGVRVELNVKSDLFNGPAHCDETKGAYSISGFAPGK